MVREADPEKREKYLDAALRLFVANGVQQTSTAEIAREAGTAAGTLFLYFPTKQDLVDELALKIGREQSATIQSLLTPTLLARAAFQAIWDGSIGWFWDHPEAYRYIRQVRDSGQISPAAVQESSRFFEYYYQAIQKGLQEGVLGPYPLELIGGMLYQAIVAVMNLLQAQPDPAARQELTRQGFEIFWNGISRS
jgi:AcrR family transcriptional regulator